MGRFSTFLHAPGCAIVRSLFHTQSRRERFKGWRIARGKDHSNAAENELIYLNLNHKDGNPNSPLPPVSCPVPAVAAALFGSLLLAACGLNGTDRNKDEAAPATTAAAE